MMKTSLKVMLLLCTLVGVQALFAQERKKGPIIVCPAETEPHEMHIPARLANAANARTTSVPSKFKVDYIDFSDEAQIAFQRAVDIWSSILKTDVTIRVQATWEPLGTGVLGSAGAGALYRDFPNAPEEGTWYPVALAEKLAGTDINDTTEYDIVASFSSNFSNWYLGTDGQGSGQYDLVSVVLHELGHGLGFFSGDTYSNGTGYWDLSDTGYPVIYTTYLENSEEESILDLVNGTAAVGSFLTSADLYLSTELVNQTNGGHAKVYAPRSYDDGSSISHWDESTFNNTDDALMTPQIAPSEVLHDPGDLMLSLFADMGWFNTDVQHEPVILANTGDVIDFNVEVNSDTSIVDEGFFLKYFYPDGDTITVELTNEGSNYHASLLPTDGASKIYYYFEGLEDGFGRTFRVPSSGAYPVAIQKINLISTPFALTDGGDFESEGNFFAVDASFGYAWEQGTTTKFGGYTSNAWVTGLDNDIEKPTEALENTLVTPIFDLTDSSADYVLSFDYRSDLSEFEKVIVYSSIDSGATWSRLGMAGQALGTYWYDTADYYGNGFFSGATVDEKDEFYMQSVAFPLYEQTGHNTLFKIVHRVSEKGMDSDYGTGGFLLDNFEISKAEPQARFYAPDTLALFPGREVQFYFASSGATSYSWDFGDGTTSIDKNPVHAYLEGGKYDVSLTITYEGGTVTETKSNYVQLLSYQSGNYSLSDGGNFDVNIADFIAINEVGTGLNLGSSSIAGKAGTHSGENAWVFGMNVSEYQNDSEAYLYSPMFDFSLIGDYSLSFYAQYSFEDEWDGFVVEYSDDFGENWNRLNEVEEDGWYDNISDANSVFGAKVPIFTGSTNGEFVLKSTDVSELGGAENPIIFRFAVLTDAAVIDIGVAIDDFELTGPVAGEISGNIVSSLTSGQSGCDDQVFSFEAEVTGSVAAVAWDFGATASIDSMVYGIGPFEVSFAEGEANVQMIVFGATDSLVYDSTFVVSSTFDVSVHAEKNDNGSYTLTATEGDSYVWYMDGDIIEGETGQTITVEESAEISVEVTIGTCTQVSADVMVKVLGLTEILEGVTLAPNPVSEKVNLQFEGDYKQAQIKIYDLSGGLVWNKSISLEGNNAELKLGALKSGLYIVEAVFDNAILYKFKLMKD